MKLEYVTEFSELTHGLAMSYEREEPRIALGILAKALEREIIYESDYMTCQMSHGCPITFIYSVFISSFNK